MVLAGLLKGIASQDLGLAAELFSKETRRDSRDAAGDFLIPLAIRRASEERDERDESLLRTLLETAVTDERGSKIFRSNPWENYTRITGDPMRSAEVLRSLTNQGNSGRKMAAIISTQNEMPFREKGACLKQNVPEGEGHLNALSSSFGDQLSNTDYQYQGISDTLIAQTPGPERDLEFHAAALALSPVGKMEEARLFAAQITEPTRRTQAMTELRKAPPDPF